MAMDAADVQAMANAFRITSQRRISLCGSQATRKKVKNAFGYTAAQEDELKAEVVRSISGKLQSGTALDTYTVRHWTLHWTLHGTALDTNRLPAATQAYFNLLSEALIDEFINL